MTKEEAIKKLQKYVFDDEECIAQDMKDYNEALKMAIEALQVDTVQGVGRYENAMQKLREMPKYLNGIKAKQIKKISADAVQGEWIPCSEKLPDNKTYVLTTIQVSGRQPHARSGFYHDGFFHNDNGDTWRATDREVRAWMPLPKPYREDGEI